MSASAEIARPNERISPPGQEVFLDILSMYPEIQPLPPELQVSEADGYANYVDRAVQAEPDIAAGIYMIDPAVGKLHLPDTTIPPRDFSKLIPGEPVDTRGLQSSNGFFAHSFTSPEGDKTILAFRPFDPHKNVNVLEDFAKNNIVRHVGLENTQTIGFYKDSSGRGGTISLLDRGIRSLDEFSTVYLLEDDGEQHLDPLAQAARELAYAHSLGISHGDVALRNIVSDDDGLAYLIDWGTSRLLRPSNEQGAIVEGTIEYDIISIFGDVVMNRPSIDGRNEDRPWYREQFIERFTQPYVQWRREFNVMPPGEMLPLPSEQLENDLARVTSLSGRMLG